MTRFFAVGSRNRLTLLGAVLALALLTACSPKKPENTVKDYIQAVAADRLNDATMYFTAGEAKDGQLAEIKENLWEELDALSAEIKRNNGLKSLSLKFADKNDDIAHADVEIKFNNDETIKKQMTLVKEAKKWKIKLDPTQSEAP